MVEVASNIVERSVSILIEPGSTHSYISPRVVEICAFKKVRHNKSWLVQLATGTKRKVSEIVDGQAIIFGKLNFYLWGKKNPRNGCPNHC